MKAVVADRIGGVEEYRVVELELPAPGSRDVLVRVHACGMGYWDALVALGGYQVKPSPPFTPGMEFAGSVAAIGDEVDGFAISDRVLASAFGGGLAEYVCVPSCDVKKMPPAMSFAQAAVFGTNYLTAMYALKSRAFLESGERLLVLGAAGGVGCAAVQLGRLMGAEVIAAASTPEKRRFALDRGAHSAIDTNPEGWRERLKDACEGRGPDVVFDPVCGALFEPAFRSLAWGGRHLVVGFVGGPIPKLPINLSLLKGAALVGVDLRQFRLFQKERASELMGELLQWVSDGRIEPAVGRSFELEQFAEAMKFAMSGQVMGKAIVRVGDQD